MSMLRLTERLVLLAVWVGGVGCVAHGVVPVQKAGSTENPVAGPAVRIDSVVDARRFQDFAGTAFTPTLAGDTDRSRAVGRRNGSGGAAFSNVLLAEELSVEAVVSEAVARALRGAGFRVVESADSRAAAATPLTLTIEKLWIVRRVVSPGGSAEADLQVRIAGPIGGLDRGAVVSTRKLVARASGTPSLWRLALEKGLDELTEKAIPELAAARSAVVRRF